MSFYARSSRGDRPHQSYRDHIIGTYEKALTNVAALAPYLGEKVLQSYRDIVGTAAFYHDLGKLNRKNQLVLSNEVLAQKLPVEHRDAGTYYLYDRYKLLMTPPALLVYAHHFPGLPDIREEKHKKRQTGKPFLFPNAEKARLDTEENIEDYLQKHREELSALGYTEPEAFEKLRSLTFRILLSCLVDADYSDASGYSVPIPKTLWQERLAKLNAYIAEQQKNSEDNERNKLRQALYDACRDDDVDADLRYCDAPVGTGKTTATMAYMINQAIARNLRRIIIVVPYTNIITQTVKILRDALVFDDEDPNEIVAELHHQVDFEDKRHRHLASTWKAPIVVMTSVQFFETLAASEPAKLRKLHALPGSGVIIDECHGVLPNKLWPMAWTWIKQLSKEWGCHFCLSSGSLHKFWESDTYQKKIAIKIEPLIPEPLAQDLDAYEGQRVNKNNPIEQVESFEDLDVLADFVSSYPGSRVVVMNTIESAANLANLLKKEKHDVLHLSTALSAQEKERVIEEVYRRLDKDNAYTGDWTLVATSVVECGLDFSFHWGFAELRSLPALLQLIGRIGRNGEYSDAKLFCFKILRDDRVVENPMLRDSQLLLEDIIRTKKLAADDITKLVTDYYVNLQKLDTNDEKSFACELTDMDDHYAFRSLAEKFRVIDEDTVTVVVNPEVKDKIQKGEEIKPAEIQRGSVSMRRSIYNRLQPDETFGIPMLRDDQYDQFLGYMKTLVK